MKRHERQRPWRAGVTVLILFSFLAGTSLACVQKGIGNIQIAEDCCQGHCQHVMTGAAAAECCQSHQTKVPQACVTTPSAKTFFLVVFTLHDSLIPPVALQAPEQFWVYLSSAERPPPSPPFYTLHCTLLI
jgi:hypothetical protein